MSCRHCAKPLEHVFVDLGFAPPSNAYLRAEDLNAPEVYYPLKLHVCDACWLVQTEDYLQANELFPRDYAYFSSASSSWLEHAAYFSDMIRERLELSRHSLVIEVAANDGYLLKNFVAAGIPCLGIEPTDSTAKAAEALGIPIVREFFGAALARRLTAQGSQADLIIGNNIYAHVPDINDFTAGLKAALKPRGVITLEFPHLLHLIQQTQFDTIYHEHFSYFSLFSVHRIFAKAGLRVWDVERLSTHGGSLRVYGCHEDDARRNTLNVEMLLEEETLGGLRDLTTYRTYQSRTEWVKDDLKAFLIEKKRQGVTMAAYGAAAKGNTLLNYAGVKPDLLPYVCDTSASKQGKYLPGSHIPILSPSAIYARRPKLVLVLPWNLRREIMTHFEFIREWGGRFVTAIPSLTIWN